MPETGARGPAISVVVPALDEADTIAATLTQFAPWRALGDEVIVVDGGSADGTRAAAAPHADHVVAAPRGRARQMNAGAALARGALLFFVHADTRLVGAARDTLLAAVREGAAWGRFDVAIDDPAPAFRVIERLMNLRSRVSGIATGDQGIFVERALFAAVGGYPDIALMEDLALSDALRRRAPPRCLPRCLATSARRWQRHGVLRTVFTMWGLRLAWRLGASPDRLARLYGTR